VLVASIAFRLPPLINAEGSNADAAVVGLQAMHILRGEWSPFLWGSGYQTSVDAMIAAFVFLFTGPSPVALMASTLAGHVVLTWLVFDMVRSAIPGPRAGAGWTAAVLVLPLVFAPDPVHTYVLYPPRQASLTVVFLAFWLLHGAASSRRPRLRFAAGGAVAALAVYADPYALLFLPAHALLAGLAAFDRRDPARSAARPEILGRLGAFAGGAVLGIVPYQILRHLPAASHGQTSLSLGVVRHNLDLLVETCGPWLFSTKVYAAVHMSDYQPWVTGAGWHAFQVLAAVILVAGLASGAVLFFAKSLSWEVRRLGITGAFMIPVTVGGFLVSPMVMDQFSSRYLAAILLVAPFCLAPAAVFLGTRRALGALALAPYLVSAAVSGWVSYRPFTLAVHPSLAVDERLGVALRERGIHYVVADYWASYRLTFAWHENPVVVPKNEVEDRYSPYRDAFAAAPVVAYVFDAYRSRERLEDVEAGIRKGETPFEPGYGRFEIGTFTVLVLQRKPVEERMAGRAAPGQCPRAAEALGDCLHSDPTDTSTPNGSSRSTSADFAVSTSVGRPLPHW
jgi:hypothetical protein